MRLSLLPCCVVAALTGSIGVAARAEALPDPTRPPAALFAPAATAGAAPARPVAAAAPRVQSIRVPAGGPPSALVDNRLVTPGDKIGGRTVVAIDAAGVQLRDARGRTERLPLIDAAVIVKRTLPVADAQAPAPVATLAGGQQP